MYFSKWKNFVIIFLIFLAIYQTNKLWFEDFSGHSLFTFQKSNIKSIDMQEDTVYLTESILINTGDNKFIRKFNNISSSEYKKIFDEAIYLAIKKGKFSYVENYDLNNILNKKCIVYTYDFDIDIKSMQNVFDIKSSYFSKLDKFDTIIISPEEENTYQIKVVFLSSKDLRAYEVEYNKDILKQNLLDTIEEFKALENKEFYFVSSQQGYSNYFNENQFLPKPKQDSFYIEDIRAYNPLEKGGGVLLSESEKYVEVFFENPALKSSSFINNTYTYSDENVIVKYYPNGILEYVEYKSGMASDDKNSDYNIAINFLKKDTNIKNEYYLTNYSIDEDSTTFYFDYKINNFPVILSKELKEETDMQSIIEITVERGRVSRYKRFIYNFDIDTEYTDVEDFESILNSYYDENGKIDKMYLAYNFYEPNQPIKIKWVLDINSETFIQEAK